jgi:hypothetical protein
MFWFGVILINHHQKDAKMALPPKRGHPYIAVKNRLGLDWYERDVISFYLT